MILLEKDKSAAVHNHNIQTHAAVMFKVINSFLPKAFWYILI